MAKSIKKIPYLNTARVSQLLEIQNKQSSNITNIKHIWTSFGIQYLTTILYACNYASVNTQF